MSTTTKNLSETKQFIEALFSRYFNGKDGYVELRFVGQDASSRFYSKGEIVESDWADIIELNRDHHVYFGVNPRPLSKNKKQNDIEDIVCLWADVDGKDFEGGKQEALRRVEGFSIPPSIIVDSGHGFHCYWVLKEPIIGLEPEQKVQIKQVLSGLVNKLGGDRSKLHLDACLRLPGTLNIKGEAPAECRILKLADLKYALGDFSELKDPSYQEPTAPDEPLPAFGSKTKQISLDNEQSAKTDVEKLEISSKTKNLIITGSLLREKGADRTRSGRDFSIICSFIYWDYDYPTIRGIFFNPFLGCSNRIREEGEMALKWDVRSALKITQKRKSEGTPQSNQIAAIKSNMFLKADERRREIAAVIVQDLLTSPKAAGEGFRDQDSGNFHFFDLEEKMLMALESIDFYCYMRERFGLAKADFEEFKDAVMTEIWNSDKTVIPRKFAYWDRERSTLYVSDHANGVYKLDGEKITPCDNGVDRVFFESDPSLAPFAFTPEQGAANYFETPKPETAIEAGGTKLTFPATYSLGLNLGRFNRDDVLLKRFMIDRASFAESPDNPLPPEEQKLLLTIYIYSVFFETQLREKPIACFVGLKESGKSFLSASIGKIFFGDKFESSGLPKTANDLAVVMGRRPYLVIDNLDTYPGSDMLDLLCAAATGVTEANRTLFTDRDMTWFTPHCFLAITSREPKFTRDDFASRLLLFSTQKIDNPISRSELIDSLLQERSAIMSEILVNLNSIVKKLRVEKARKHGRGDGWQPIKCFSRLADWETFGRTICSFGSGVKFQLAIQLMNDKKDRFTLEDDYLYQVLSYSLLDNYDVLRNMSPQYLYERMVMIADEMRIRDFQRRYKSAISMAKHLANIVGELRKEFEVEICEVGGRRKEYTFRAFGDPMPEIERILGEREMTKVLESERRRRIDFYNKWNRPNRLTKSWQHDYEEDDPSIAKLAREAIEAEDA